MYWNLIPGHQASYAGVHSIFTYYFIQGLNGNEDSVDIYGNVTPDSLGKYVFDKVTAKLPRQKPITKTEISGHIILAHYPNLIKTKNTTLTSKDPFTVNVEQGNSHFSTGNYEQAIRCYDIALRLNGS